MARLSSRQLLLVLDNCEHLSDACASVAEALLSECTRLRVLATSREPLRLLGEMVWRLPPLPVPDTRRVTTLNELATCASVGLFVERAQSSRVDFTLTPDNARSIAHICALVEGLPLGLELAAAQVRALGVEQICDRLSRSLPLPANPNRAVGRHRTIEATLDWSYALLTGLEQTVFRRLAVFAGGWTLEAAEAVCSGANLAPSEVLDLLVRLVDRSLVIMGEHQGKGRYRLLEPIRQYAWRLLLDSDDADLTRRRHAEYFRELAERLEAASVGPHVRAMDVPRQAEVANFRVAMDWAVESAQPDLGLSIAGALATFWTRVGWLAEGREWFARLLRMSADATPARAKALAGAGAVAYYQGDHSAASALLAEGVAMTRELGDPVALANTLDSQGLVHWARAELEPARVALGTSLELARQQGLRSLEMRCLYHLGLVAYDRGDFDAARDWHTQSLTAAAELGDILTQARAYYGLGHVAREHGDLARAKELHEAGLVRRREMGESWGVALALVGLGQVSLDEADLAGARARFVESLSLSHELGDRHGLARSLEGMAAVAARDQPERAWQLVGAAEALRDSAVPRCRQPRRCSWSVNLLRREAHSAMNAAPRSCRKRGPCRQTKWCGWP